MRWATQSLFIHVLLYLGVQVFGDLSTCHLLHELENGHYEQLSDIKLKAVCDTGYTLVGKVFLKCLNGQWYHTHDPVCIKPENECPSPPKLDNGQLVISGKRVGTTIIYQCNEGFFMIGENKRTCTNQRYWSGVPPNCHPKDRKPEEMVEMLRHHLDTNVTALNATAAHGRILGPEIYELGLDLFFLLDRSSSVDPIDFQSAKKFVIKLVKVFKGNENREKGTRVSVISFGDHATVEIGLSDATYNSVNATVARIEQIKGEGGGTAMQPAFSAVFDSFEKLRPNAKKALFLLTDGEPNIYTAKDIEPEDLAKNLKKSGFEIYCIGVGKDIGSKRLIKIASEPAINHVFMLDKYSKFDQVLDYIQKPLTTTPAPPPPGPDACGFLGEGRNEAMYETKSKQYPWMAAIFVSPKLHKNETEQVKFCSGVVISDRWILTNGLCIKQHVKKPPNIKQITVVLGTQTLSSKEGLNFYATNISLSPLPQHEPNLLPELQLALIKVERKIPMKDGLIRPICLPNPNNLDVVSYQNEAKSMTSIEGWGSMANHKANKKLALTASYVSLTSRRIKVDKFNVEQDCKSFLTRTYKDKDLNIRLLADKFLCIGNREEGFSQVRRKPSVCSGNYGSPLVTKDEKTKRFTLLGIQSSRYGCSDVKSYYLLVKYYTHWLDRITGGINPL